MKMLSKGLLLITSLFIVACSGSKDSGKDGTNGKDGTTTIINVNNGDVNTSPTTTTTLPPVACPTNSYTATASSLAACTSAPGYYDCSSGTCKDVGAGYYSLGGDNTRTQCPAGSYSTGLNNSTCTACGSGTFQSSTGQTSCGACTNVASNALAYTYSNLDSALSSNSCTFGTITCSSGHYDNGSHVCVSCTNVPANAASATYSGAESGLTTNTCTVTSVTCNQYYHSSGATCVANTVASPSGGTASPTASILSANTTITATVDANTTTLSLYSDSNCTSLLASGTAAQAASGITITGLTDQTTNIYGKSSNTVSAQSSSCVSLTTFKYWPSDTFNATYATTHSLSACDGTQNFTENLTSCIGQNTAISDNSKCASTSSIQYQSPAGTKDVSITNGTRHDTCALGSSTADSFTLDCDLNTYKTASSLLCINPTMAVNNQVASILFDEPNNVIYLAGNFTQYNSVALSGTYNLIKVNATTGARDTNFNVTFTGSVPAHAAVVLDSTKTNLYLGGAFTQVNGTNRTSLAKVSASTGALDATFDASSEINSWGSKSIYGINEYGSDIYVNGGISGTGVSGVAKFDKTTGAVNSTFKTNSMAAIVQTNQTAYSTKMNSGLLYVSGTYTTAGGAPRNNVFSLNSDGTLNSSFDAGLTAYPIYASGIKDGYLYVAHLAKLKKLSLTTGAEDTSFAMPVVTGGPILGFGFYGSSIYVGGSFNGINGLSTNGVAKVALSDGSVDIGFVVTTLPGSIKTYFVTGELFLIGGTSSPYLRSYNSSTGEIVW